MITVLYKTGNGIDLIGTLELTSSVGFNHFVVLLMLVRLKLFKMSDRGSHIFCSYYKAFSCTRIPLTCNTVNKEGPD